jgi:integrase
LLVNGYADKDVLKDRYLNHQPHKKKRPLSFWDFFEEFIEFKRKELNDIKDYNNSLRKHLIATEKIIKRKATFESIKKFSGGFIDEMSEYLTHEALNSKGNKGMTVNSIGKQSKNLKVFLNWCFNNNHIEPFSLKHIVTITEEIDAIYLEKDELQRLSNLILIDDTEKRIRDAFILSCNTALRISDLKALRNSHITCKSGNRTICIQQKKTGGKKILIPINKVSTKILEDYDNSSPIKNFNETHYNTTIRDLCKRAKIDDNVVIYRTEKGKSVEYDYKKYELVESRTGRRTFCTLMMKKKVPIDIIMSVSGHKSYKSFFSYLKMKPIDYAEEMRKYMD